MESGSPFEVIKIIGEAEILVLIEDTLYSVWEKTKDYAGIDKKFFDEYYKNKKSYCVLIRKCIKYDIPNWPLACRLVFS
ncbi:hypothetical protein Q2T46_02945 [Thermoanaerobacterium sp. CMT5567-10]|uniref:hypothetical protein n=1 Tax=Thermoanaerobacterium sp. CMT5567-10 TaxID=3061989 RepID=UPI0026E04BFF|nr:hypothetical protein [Thermoanaerobacterium sp. CMT5567-10]WKV09432.1 hypothetical protein Q2T46_02945 [Thermoanaerobacterium sp. CMT5567-10]